MPSLEIEEKVARLEGRLDEHSKFFESISVKLTLLEERGDRNREEIEKRIISLENKLDDRIDSLRAELGSRIDAVDRKLGSRIDAVDRKLDSKIDSVNSKIDSVNSKIDSVNSRIDSVRAGLDAKIDSVRAELSRNFRWIVGIQITTWITILLAILFKR